MKNKRGNNKKKGRGGGKRSSGGGAQSNDGSSAAIDRGTAAAAAAAPSPPPAVSDAESVLLEDLRSRTRSLFASVGGCAPDGSPLAQPNNPLARLHASVVELTDELIRVQSDRRREKAELASDGGSSAETRRGRDDPRAWERFSAWLKKCGIDPVSRDFPVEIRETTTSDGCGGSTNSKGYGLFATRDVKYDEVVLEIPVEAMMCPYFDHFLERGAGTTGDEDDDGCVAAPRPPPFDASRPKDEDEGARPLCLVTFIANERWRGTRSAFQPYLDILPSTYSTPLFWSIDEIRALSHLKRAVTLQALTMWEYLQVRDMIKRVHLQGEVSNLVPVEEFTYELFRWATVTAHTRQNLVPFSVSSSRIARPDTAGDSKEIQTALSLVPLWDLLNHEDSDRSCVTAVAVVGDEADGSKGGQNDRPRQGVLVCRTPSKPSNMDGVKGVGDDDTCFHSGEQITMYYGERSNAQLLFHSGFLNGEGEENKNRSDHALLRVALPAAERDGGLDRIREMVAARFGFKAYADQGCRHDGIMCADAAASVVGHCADGDPESIEHNGTATSRKREEVVMAEFSVSPRDPCPDDLKRALLLCVGTKSELAHLLRNMNRYLASRSASSGSDGTPGTLEETELLELNGKHLQLVSKLVEIQNDEYKKSERSLDRKSAKMGTLLAADLARFDNVTLNEWLQEFRLHCVPHANGVPQNSL